MCLIVVFLLCVVKVLFYCVFLVLLRCIDWVEMWICVYSRMCVFCVVVGFCGLCEEDVCML